MKFADAELLGLPVILVVGRSLAKGVVEVRRRRDDVRQEVTPADALAAVQALLAEA